MLASTSWGRESLVPGGWVSGPEGVCLVWGGWVSGPGGCLPGPGGGLASQYALRQTSPLWTESQTPVKTLPWPNFVAAGNNV